MAHEERSATYGLHLYLLYLSSRSQRLARPIVKTGGGRSLHHVPRTTVGSPRARRGRCSRRPANPGAESRTVGQ